MNILILGGGEVGKTVVKNLTKYSNHDITVIDYNIETIKDIENELDVQTMCANVILPSNLQKAGADNADLLLALTKNDDTNIVACLLGEKIFNIPKRIARIRYGDIVEFKQKNIEGLDEPILPILGITEYICPEQIITDEILKIFEYSNALQIVDFEKSGLQTVSTKIDERSLLVNKTILEINEHFKIRDIDVNFFALYRDECFIPVTDNIKIIDKDEIFFISKKKNTKYILESLNDNYFVTKKIMIAGGGNIGYRLANAAEKKYNIKIIEYDNNRAEWLSEELESSLVLNGSATDENLLKTEAVKEVDIFCALTNDDEDNVMSSLLAKKYGAKKLITLINRSSYIDLLLGNQIDIIISPHITTIGSVLSHIRKNNIISINPLKRGTATIIEAKITGSQKNSKIIGKKLKNIKLPYGCNIIAITKENKNILFQEDYMVENGDNIIFFLEREYVIDDLEKLLEMKWTLF